MRPWLTKYLYSDPNFYIHFELFRTSTSSLQTQLEKIDDNLTTFCQKAHELLVFGKLHRMYPHILTHQASQSLDPFISILRVCIPCKISNIPGVLLVELKGTQRLVQLEQCQRFQGIDELLVPQYVQGGVAEEDFGITVLLFEIGRWLAGAVVIVAIRK